MTTNNYRIIRLVSLANATWLCFVALLIASTSAAMPAVRPLNVLLIVADDLNGTRWCTLPILTVLPLEVTQAH